MPVSNGIEAPVRSKNLVIQFDAGIIHVSYDLPAKMIFRLRVLEAEVRRRVRSHLRRAKPIAAGSDGGGCRSYARQNSQKAVVTQNG